MENASLFLKKSSSGTEHFGLPLWLTIGSGAIFTILALVFIFFSIKTAKKHKEMMLNFEKSYNKMSSREKGNFTKEEFLNTNISMWNRNKHILFPLLSIICAILAIIFFTGQQIGIGI